MEVTFKRKKLKRCFEDSRYATREFGDVVARKYVQRVNIIQKANDIETLKALPGFRCHALKGDRNGQWAINLTGRMRLIFTLQGSNLEIAHIEEVSKHYGD